MNEKPLGSSARRQVELVFQGDLLEGGQGIDAEVPAAGLRKRDVGDVPVAVGAEHGLAFYRSNATLGQAQRQRGFLRWQQVSIAGHQLQHKTVGADVARRNKNW